MKKIILTTAIIFATVAVSMAQESRRNTQKSFTSKSRIDSLQKRTPEERAKTQANKMKNSLGLNDQQTQAIYNLNLSREQKRNVEWTQIRAKRKEIKVKYEKMLEKRNTELKEYNDQLYKILNKDQFAKLEQMKTDRKEKMQERMRKRANGRKKFINKPTPKNS